MRSKLESCKTDTGYTAYYLQRLAKHKKDICIQPAHGGTWLYSDKDPGSTLNNVVIGTDDPEILKYNPELNLHKVILYLRIEARSAKCGAHLWKHKYEVLSNETRDAILQPHYDSHGHLDGGTVMKDGIRIGHIDPRGEPGEPGIEGKQSIH